MSSYGSDVQIFYPCGCVEHIGITDRKGKAKPDVLCKKTRVVRKNGKNEWADCYKRKQRDMPVPAELIPQPERPEE